MILSVSVMAATSVAFLLSSGYLFGARRGVGLRQALRVAREREQARGHALELRVAELTNAADELARLRVELDRATRKLDDRDDRGRVAALQDDLHALSTMIRERDTQDATLRAELRSEMMALAQGGQDPVRFERELRRIVGSLLERHNDTQGLRDLVKNALGPILDKERLGRELAQLEGGSSLGELPRLLDAIAEKGGFASVVLSDDVGLPLAASSSASSVDWLAGMASLILTLVERAARAGESKPIGVVIHDESNQRILHRIFQTGGASFLLTAVTKGQDVTPSALDVALGKLERALTRPEIHA